MHKKNIAYEFEEELPQFDGTTSEEELIALHMTISSALMMNPNLYTNDKSLWIYYGHSYFQCEILFNDMLYSLAMITRKYPLSIYGCANGTETAQIRFLVDGDKVKVQKLDVSGKDFNELYDLCLRIDFDDENLLKLFEEILGGIDYRNDFLLIRRNSFTNQAFTHYPDFDKNTYYRYLPMQALNEIDTDNFSYTLNQQIDLWLLLLEDGVSAVEFNVFMDKLEEGRLNSFFTWELALRFALDQAGYTISYNENGFEMRNRQGERLIYDYINGSSAEQLLLKIIFPASPIHH